MQSLPIYREAFLFLGVSKSKKIFAGLAVVFAILLLYASYDISMRTTFPGSKPQLKERINEQFLKQDSARKDSVNNRSTVNPAINQN